jgi:tyrosyl-tRNA synthetase
VSVWQATAVPTFSGDLQFRGLVHQVTDPSVPERLDTSPPVVAYIGFDPSAPSLHVGSLMQLCTLRRLQAAGHRPIALAGGGTGLIGDPGGKSEERPLLGYEELAANLEGIRPQLERFLDFSGPRGALLLDNADWLRPLSAVELLRDVGKHFTVNQMVAKESVKARLEQGISYTEFSYMLLQAYDFLRLYLDHGCTLQVGGSDQWGNITVGVDLVRRVARAEVHGLTTPLVTKADGTKFGKTEAGAVWLDATMTSPYRLYQFLLQSEDAVVGHYLRYFTFLDHDEIAHLDAEIAARPEQRAAQRALAQAVVTLVHGEDEAERSARASASLFDGDLAGLDERSLLDVVEDAPSSVVSRDAVLGGELALVDALVTSGLASSKSDARRTITQGGAYVNDRREPDESRLLGPADLLHDRYVVLRRGRRDYHLLRVG